MEGGSVGGWSVGAARPLEFLRPVPRTLVHRAAMTEVFLTDAVKVGDDAFLVAAQWPRDHSLYHPDLSGRTDPLLFAETIRQALVYLAHEYYDVPLGHRFVAYDLDFQITDASALRVAGAPHAVVLEARCATVGHRPPRRHGLRMEVVLTVDGEVCGRGGFRFVAVDERVYRALRARNSVPGDHVAPASAGTGGSATSVSAEAVGRLRGKDCVLERMEPGGEWRMRVDTDHAILFDHPSDHLPLMVAMEGFRQLGHLLTHDDPSGGLGQAPAAPHTLVSCAVTCHLFAELNLPVSLAVRDDRRMAGARRLRVDAVQCGRVIAGSTMVWAEPLP
ncbi:ScbA/BarX family gamma-butyrolactone biosynthesis protein [Streptomyces sp. NPDC048612]|uniref:ScbA/BarX family gamma-butyrolactone biosynthesis protein n=1 Tax=Streptomyces sp. NPDC048612 TaxID=3365579 RepID=UPI00371E8A76